MDIDPFWTAAGLDAAVRNGISPAEAMDVLYGEPVIVWWDNVPTRMSVLGGRPGRRAVVLVLDREYRETTRYGVTDVRHANDIENSAWEKRQR